MKRNRNPTNKSVMKRYATLDSSISSRSFFDQFSFILRSPSVHPPFILRSSSIRESKNDRRLIEVVSEIHRKQDGDVSKLYGKAKRTEIRTKSLFFIT